MKSRENKTEQEEMTKIKSETVMLTFMKQTTNCTRLHTSHFKRKTQIAISRNEAENRFRYV